MLDEELTNLQLDKPARGKTAEQIKKHSLDQQYENKPVERSLHLLTKGDELQKLSVLQNLPNSIQQDEQGTLTRVLPIIQQELTSASSEFHLNTSKAFQILIERKLVNPQYLTHAVTQGIESRDPFVANAWLDMLLQTMHLFSVDIVKNFLQVALHKGDVNEPPVSRVIASKILGKIALHPKFSSNDIKKEILPLIQSLCQDVSYDVRATVCAQLSSVAKGLENEVVKTHLLPSLIELASDENTAVRAAAVTAIIQIFPYLSQETLKLTMVPLVTRLCELSLKYDDQASLMVAKEFGLLANGLEKSFTVKDATWMLYCYGQLARRGLTPQQPGDIPSDVSQEVTCRNHCATNLPSMTWFTINILPNQLDQLYCVFRDLAADPCYIIRRTVAGIVHEIAHILGPQNRMIKSDLVRLLRDDSEDVLQLVVPQLGTTLMLLATHGTLSNERTESVVLELGRSLLKCQLEISRGNNWRLLALYLLQLECLPMCFPADFIHTHFTPMVLSCAVSGRAKPVRSQAARTLLIFLRYNNKAAQRLWLRERLIIDLAHSPSCYTRHIFIRMCMHGIEIFSGRYFKEFFYVPLLELSQDEVANIRLCVVALLPELRHMLRMPLDRKLHLQLEQVVSYLETNEKDRDVLELLVVKCKQMLDPSYFPHKDVIEAEEKRKETEEDIILKGGKPPVGKMKGTSASIKTASDMNMQSSNKSVQKTESPRSSSLNRQLPRPSSITNPRSSSVPSRNSSKENSNMKFLEKHFYIDAGIKLPEFKSRQTDDVKVKSKMPKKVVVKETRIAKQSIADNEADVCEELYKNETDDAKVNLKKMSRMKCNQNDVVSLRNTKEVKQDEDDLNQASTSIPVLRNKRHSSIYSASCIEVKKTTLKRRSLNIQPKENSKIPVSSSIAKKGVIDEQKQQKTRQTNIDNQTKQTENKVQESIIMTENSKEDINIGTETKDKMESVEKANFKPSVPSKSTSGTGLPVLIRRKPDSAIKVASKK